MGDYVYAPPFEYTPCQQEARAANARYTVLNWGRRTGKSIFGIDWSVQEAIKIPNERHWYIAKTYKQAEEVSWREFNEVIPEEIIKKIDKRSLTFELINGSLIQLKGSDKEDSLRGGRLGSAVFDEAAYQKHTVYGYIIRPRLADLRARALFLSTPRPGWFLRMFNLARESNDPKYFASHRTIYDNPHISREEIEEIKKTTAENVWRQEYLAEVVDQSGIVYHEFDPAVGVFEPSRKFAGHRNWKCVVGIDYGSNDDTGVVWLHVSPEGFVVASQEHVKNGWDVEKHAGVIKMKSRGLSIGIGDYVLDKANFKNDHTSGRSVADLFRQHSIGCTRSERDLNATIDFMKRFLRGDGQRPWLNISLRCAGIINALQSWEYGEHEPDILAALRYGLAHIVKRGYSNLAQHARFDHSETPYIESIKAQSGANRWEKPSGDSRWSWDMNAGVPI